VCQIDGRGNKVETAMHILSKCSSYKFWRHTAQEICQASADHVYYKVFNYERKLHTKHGMHLNTIGKEYVASQLVSLISSIEKDTTKEERDIIPLAPNAISPSIKHLHNHLLENSGVMCRKTCETSSPTKRKRRLIARNEDFLWE
jgi:hypothetical protein